MGLNKWLCLLGSIGLLFAMLFFFIVTGGVKKTHLLDKYERAITKGCEDAVSFALLPETSDDIEIAGEGSYINFQTGNVNLVESLKRFYETYALSMNVDNRSNAMNTLKAHVPIKVLIAYDGYYINYWQEREDESGYDEVWTDKIEFVYHDEVLKKRIYYTLDDVVRIVDDKTGEENICKYTQVSSKENSDFFSGNYEETKRSHLADTINKALQIYNNTTNEIALKNGYKYDFKLFTVPERAIDDITFLAFVQFDPVSMGKKSNMFAFGGSKLLKNQYVYGDSKTKTYHRKDCENVSKFDKIFDNAKSASKNGYKPDLDCLIRD